MICRDKGQKLTLLVNDQDLISFHVRLNNGRTGTAYIIDTKDRYMQLGCADAYTSMMPIDEKKWQDACQMMELQGTSVSKDEYNHCGMASIRIRPMGKVDLREDLLSFVARIGVAHETMIAAGASPTENDPD